MADQILLGHDKRFIVDDYSNGEILRDLTLRTTIHECSALGDAGILRICEMEAEEELDFGGYTITRTV